MDLEAAGAGMEDTGRTAAFQHGSAGMPYRVASSMGENSARFNDAVGSGFHPASVLNQVSPVMNGMSATDFSRRLPGGVTLPTANGTDATTYQQLQVMKMIGRPY